MSIPDGQQRPDRTRNDGRRKDTRQGEPPDVNRPGEVAEIPGLGLPTEDVELDERPVGDPEQRRNPDG